MKAKKRTIFSSNTPLQNWIVAALSETRSISPFSLISSSPKKAINDNQSFEQTTRSKGRNSLIKLVTASSFGLNRRGSSVNSFSRQGIRSKTKKETIQILEGYFYLFYSFEIFIF